MIKIDMKEFNKAMNDAIEYTRRIYLLEQRQMSCIFQPTTSRSYQRSILQIP